MSDALRTAKLSDEALNFLSGTPPNRRRWRHPLKLNHSPRAGQYLPAPNPLTPPASNHYADKIIAASLVVLPAIVSMTFRLPASLTARLARVAAERKLQRERPFSQQDIVAVALDEWLQRNGYAKQNPV